MYCKKLKKLNIAVPYTMYSIINKNSFFFIMLISKRWTEQLMTAKQPLPPTFKESTNIESKSCKDNKKYSFLFKVSSLVNKIVVENNENDKTNGINQGRCSFFDDMW